MPAALDVDWAALRTLAVAVGLAEAAQRTGISYDAIRQRSSREGWLTDIPRSQPLPPSVRKIVTGVTSAAEALASSMRDDAIQGRAAALRISRRALQKIDKMPDAKLVKRETAEVAHTWVKSAATAGGYGSSDAVARVDLRIVGQRGTPATIEAEWSEAGDGQAFTE